MLEDHLSKLRTDKLNVWSSLTKEVGLRNQSCVKILGYSLQKTETDYVESLRSWATKK